MYDLLWWQKKEINRWRQGDTIFPLCIHTHQGSRKETRSAVRAMEGVNSDSLEVHPSSQLNPKLTQKSCGQLPIHVDVTTLSRLHGTLLVGCGKDVMQVIDACNNSVLHSCKGITQFSQVPTHSLSLFSTSRCTFILSM